MAFDTATRRKIIPIGTITRPTGGGVQTLTLPKVGLLARLWLVTSGSIAGSLSAQNTLGFCSTINRVRLKANAGFDIFSASGPGQHWLLRDYQETELIDPLGHTTGRTAVTATTFTADMVIPVAVNLRDAVGLIMLQNEQTQIQLDVDFLADASVATAATVTETVVVYMEYFSVPVSTADWPGLDLLHQILEDQVAVTSGVDYPYSWARGNTYMQVLHGLGIGVSGTGADSWSRARLRVNQSEFLEDWGTAYADLQFYYTHGRARPKGLIAFDWMGSSGLGMYGKSRDMFNSALVTDVASLITPTATTTLYTVRRMLAPVM